MKSFTILGVAAVSGEVVRVPGGHAVEESCIVEVKNGELFDVDNYEPSEACRSGGGVQAPRVQIYASDTHMHSDSSFTYFSADWDVPPLPQRAIGQVVYFWPGFKSKQPEMGLPVLQPVLQYGQRGGEWELQSWFVDGNDPRYPVVTAPAIRVQPGDKITSYMSLNDDKTCTVYGENKNSGQTSNLKIRYSRAGNCDYDYAMLVNENIGVDTYCSAMPDDSNQPGIVTFTNISLATVDGSVPEWITRANCKGNYQCDCDNSATVDGKDVKLGWSTHRTIAV